MGFPCQDLSNAGRRAGLLDGERSGLWRECARLISEVQPQYAIIENVAALLQSNHRFDILLSDLAACGYDCQWDVIPAAAFGAPHLRERAFVVAYARRERCDDGGEPQIFAPIARKELSRWTPTQSLECVEVVGRAYPGLPAHLRMDDGLAARLDAVDKRVSEAARLEAWERIHACGNAVVPDVAEHVGRCLLSFHLKRQKRDTLRPKT